MAEEWIEDVLKERIRVIEHYKRIFAIICGLAITVACANAYSCWAQGDRAGIAQFIIMLFCIVPVFHGAERSLDIQYLQRWSKRPSPGRLVVDFIVLLVTGLFFYLIAQSIPSYRPQPPAPDEIIASRIHFLIFLTLFFPFDVCALAAGLLKSDSRHPKPAGHEQRVDMSEVYRSAHRWWIGTNAAMGAMAGWQMTSFAAAPDAAPAVPGAFWVVGIAALARTIIDYRTGWRFLFPPEDIISP